MGLFTGLCSVGFLEVTESNVTLDRVSSEDQYNLATLYHEQGVSNDDIDEQIISINDDCKYYAPEQFANLNTGNCFTSFCINCQSLTAHWDGLQDLLFNMNTGQQKIDIIGLTEIFRIQDNINYSIEGYHPIICKTRPDSGRGGVAMYVNENFQFTIREDLSVFIPHVIETLFVEMSIPNIDKVPIIIGVIYRPNSPPLADIDVFSYSFLEVITLINNEKKQLLVLGDFNICLLKFQTHAKTSSFLDPVRKPSMRGLTSITVHHRPTNGHVKGG